MSTVVSCYYKIKSTKPHSKYLEYIANFMELDFNSVIFCNQESYNILVNLYPENNHRKYRIVEIKDFFVNQFDWESDWLIDHEKNIHSPDLYKVWNEKIFFVERAIRENIYNSSSFFWTDIGSFRDKERLVDFKTYPSPNYLVKDRVSMLLVNLFHPDEIKNPEIIDNRFLLVDRIGAGIFGGFIEPLLKYRDLYLDMLGKFTSTFKGKEQSLMNFIFIQNPHLFDIIITTREKGYDKWFYLHYYFSLKNTLTEKTN
jgi:hypothetical protein